MAPTATWTTPKDWVDGEIVDAAEMNIHLRNNMFATYTGFSARVYHSVNQSIPTGAVSLLSFNTERHDSNSFHSTSVNTTRFTIPAGLDGVYLIGASVAYASNATGIRVVNIQLNGTTNIASDTRGAVNGAETCFTISTLHTLAAGNYVEVEVFHTAGVALNVNAGANYSPEFWIVKV